MRKILSVVMVFLLILPALPIAAAVSEEQIIILTKEETAKELALSAQYSTKQLSSGSITVVIHFDLESENFLKLFDTEVLRIFTKYAYEKQQEFADEGTVLMSANHIAGETWLHIFGYRITKMFGGANGPMSSFYESCRGVELNVDEDRISPMLISIAGHILLNQTFTVNPLSTGA